MNLFIFKETISKTEFKTVITREYLSITKEEIEWRWELTTGSWDGTKHHYHGYVPYISNIKTNIYQYIQGKDKMIMSSLLADDNSYRLQPQYCNYFNLNKRISAEYN